MLPYMVKFVNFVDQRKGTRSVNGIDEPEPILLLGDQHSSRYLSETINYAMENKVIIMLAPPNCTKYVQPLDVGVFSPFKKNISEESHKLSIKSTIDRYDLAKITNAPFQKITKDIILSSFKATGIFPTDITVVDKKIKKEKKTYEEDRKTKFTTIVNSLQRFSYSQSQRT